MIKGPANQMDIYNDEELAMLSNCFACPRNCMVNRVAGEKGYCNTDAGLNIASICMHMGEEPFISGKEGICNIFFSGCNLRCIYCQNHEISRNSNNEKSGYISMDTVLDKIEQVLKSGINMVGFVSPSHVIPQVKAIIRALKGRNINPVYVYNTNSYDKVTAIRELDGLIDVYLSDYKYVTNDLAGSLSGVNDYPEIALKAIREMYFQVGSTVPLDEENRAERGLIIRHLVLPGRTEESKKILRSISDNLSTGVHISLMSQYQPVVHTRDHPLLSRPLLKDEYDEVVGEMERLGFRNGWIQEMDSFRTYNPDFTKENPFEN